MKTITCQRRHFALALVWVLLWRPVWGPWGGMLMILGDVGWYCYASSILVLPNDTSHWNAQIGKEEYARYRDYEKRPFGALAKSCIWSCLFLFRSWLPNLDITLCFLFFPRFLILGHFVAQAHSTRGKKKVLFTPSTLATLLINQEANVGMKPMLMSQ